MGLSIRGGYRALLKRSASTRLFGCLERCRLLSISRHRPVSHAARRQWQGPEGDLRILRWPRPFPFLILGRVLREWATRYASISAARLASQGMDGESRWRKYERQIHDRLVKMAGGENAEVIFDGRLPGRLSGTERQVDVLVRGEFAGGVGEATMAVDCKCFSKKVDVEAFVGLVDDVGTDLGLIVTTGA